MLSAEFVLTSLLIILIPGTGAIYTLSQGLFGGVRASLAAALGCTLGIIPHLLASILGLSFVLHLSALVFTALKVAGALYLLYLAWALWRDEGALTFGASAETGQGQLGLGQIVWRAVLLNLLNPKLTLFFFAFLPLALTPEAGSPLVQMVRLSLVFMLLTLVVFALYGVLASLLRQRILRSPRGLLWLKRTFAASFALLGVRLALEAR